MKLDTTTSCVAWRGASLVAYLWLNLLLLSHAPHSLPTLISFPHLPIHIHSHSIVDFSSCQQSFGPHSHTSYTPLFLNQKYPRSNLLLHVPSHLIGPSISILRALGSFILALYCWAPWRSELVFANYFSFWTLYPFSCQHECRPFPESCPFPKSRIG